MAIRYAVANGNWSSTSTWDGGASLPTSGDDVYANNFVVAVNQNITVNSLKKISNGSPAIAAGGSFNVTTAAVINITAGIAAADNVTNSTYLLQINAGSAAVTINGNITSGNGNGRVAVSVASGYTGTLTINGNLSNGDLSGFANAYAVSILGACTVNVTGNLVGTTGAGSPTMACSAAAIVTVTGNVTGNTLGSGAAGIRNTGASAQFTIIGTVTGGASGSHGIFSSAASARVTVVGAVTGGTAGSYGIQMTAGSLRLDAILRWGSTGEPPVRCDGVKPQFVRAFTTLGMAAPSDDNWPLSTGSELVVMGSMGPDVPEVGIIWPNGVNI